MADSQPISKQTCALRDYPIVEEDFVLPKVIVCDKCIVQCISCKEYTCYYHGVTGLVTYDDFEHICCKCVGLNKKFLYTWNGKSSEWASQTSITISKKCIAKLVQIYDPLTKPCK